MRAKFVVFFSFKGGVGRSSSLLNTARILTKKGKDVVVIDFDIAAPGLDIFEGTDLKITNAEWKAYKKWQGLTDEDIKEQKINNSESIQQKGVTEYLLKKIDRLEQKESSYSTMDLKDYYYRHKVIHIDDEKQIVSRMPDPTEGKMYIFRAGLHEDKTYSNNQRILDGKISELIDIINNPTSEQTDDKGADDEKTKYMSMLNDFKKEIGELDTDYVLIDARPGLSSISIMAMQKLADVVVLCFNLNPWNYESIKGVYKSLTTEWKEYIVNEWQKILLVITPIPRYAFQYESYQQQKARIGIEMSGAINPGGANELGPIEVPYNEQMTLQDKLIADDDSFKDDATYHAYQDLAEMLIRTNPEDIENKIKKAKEGKSINETIKELKRLTRSYSHKNKVQILHNYGEFLLGIGRYSQAINPLQEAVDESEGLSRQDDGVEYAGNSELYYSLGFAHFNMCQDSKFQQNNPPEKITEHLRNARKIFGVARDKGKTAELTFIVEGDSLLEEAQFVPSSEMLDVLMKAKDEYKDAIKANNLEAEYHFKLGKVNATISDNLKNIDDIIDFRNKANKNFDAAISLRQDYAEAYFNQGRNLYNLSKYKPNEKDKLLEEANEIFKKAIKYRRDYAEAYYLWALSISKMSTKNINQINKIINDAMKSGQFSQIDILKAYTDLATGSKIDIKPEKRAELLDSACVNFGRGTTYKKNFNEAYFFWGAALFILQKQKELLEEEIEGKIYFRDAFYKLEQAISLFFDYPDFYFDPDEISEIEKNTYVGVSVLESMFEGDENTYCGNIYETIRDMAKIPKDFESLFEPQFKNWLNETELADLEQRENDYMEYYTKLILKSVFKGFMTGEEKEIFKELEDSLKKKSIEDMTTLIGNIVERDSWKNRKSTNRKNTEPHP